ncbi:MAG: PKD domain-containing protein [Flavobacteriales bacterium]|nr:PKD domain-containing protein [Flavobacteriales bacterium]
MERSTMERRAILMFILLCCNSLVRSQYEQRYLSRLDEQPEWVRLMYAPDPDPGAVEDAYNRYYASHPFVKNNNTQYYWRWLRGIVHERVPRDPEQRSAYPEDQRHYLEMRAQAAGQRGGGVWTPIGPFDWDHGAASKSYACGAAHVYTVEQALTNTDIVYAGTANAGVWKSTDKGLNWTNLTKDMILGTVLSLEIDHANANIVYFGAEGHLYKTTNGGATWNTIGDAAFQALDHSIRDIVMHPTNSQQVFVCSSQGLYRTDNGGTSFTQVESGIWQELEFHPTNPSVIYAVKQTGNVTQFWRSTNGGISFFQMTAGWPAPVSPDEQKRTEIAVSAAAPNTVYALCTGVVNGGSGLYGVYKSTDMGASWGFTCCGPQPGGAPSAANMNLMGWSDQGLDDGGQYYYDLAFAVDPADANKVTVCGVNRWVSTDGGVSFTCPAKWSESNKVDYVHADIHDMHYYGSDIWIACDGGIFYSNDGEATFQHRMFGITGTDFWGFGQGGWTGGEVMLGGTYHNGTLLKDNNVYENGWVSTDGGDNERGFVFPQDDRRAVSDYGGKVLSGDRTVDDGTFDWSKLPNASYIIGESSEIVWHPNDLSTAFIGEGNTLWKTTDQGASFTAVHDFGQKVTGIQVAFSDPRTIYVCTYPGWWDAKHVYRTTNGGGSWTEITPSSAAINGNTWVPYDIAVSGTDPQTIWLVRTSQYGDYPNINGYVVYKSINGGTSWTNITDANLDNEWPTNIAHQLGSAGDLYIGTRRGVYYRSDALPTWTLYNNGLPAQIFSTRLLIQYEEGKIRNGTDRSVWEAPVHTPTSPLANIVADRRQVDCLTPTVQFYDNSALNGTNASWSWSFPGGSPATSTIRDPQVTYPGPGSYDVTLTVTDVNGTDTKTFPAFIAFATSSAATPFVEDVESGATVPPGWTLENPDDATTWGTVTVANGPDCSSTTCWRMDHYYYNAPGQEDRLVTPLLDLAGSAGTRLRFDHAYVRYAAGYDDGFRVEISDDCGANWSVVYAATGTALATAPDQGNPWEPADCSEWQAHDIDISAFDGEVVLVRFVAINDYGNRFYLDNVEVVNTGAKVAMRVFLEGAYDQNTGLMRDDLRAAGLIPDTEPFTAAGFTQAGGGGGEQVQSGVRDVTGPNAVVDWVLVELRSAVTPSTILATRAALVQRDGDVVGMDGTSEVALNASPGTYYVAIRHRNHLGVMTASTRSLSTTATAIDLTNGGTMTYGAQAQKTIASVRVLWTGNARQDDVLKYAGANNDRDPILTRIGGTVPTAVTQGYYQEDNTMDGLVKYAGANNDRDPVLQNIGGTVPTATRQEQLP